jgi:hypothetical protein
MALVELDYAQITSDVACTATTEAGANTIITGAAKTYDGSTIITLEFFWPAWTTSTTNTVAFLTIFQDGSVFGRIWDSFGFTSAADMGGTVIARRFTPSAGSHTYSIRGHSQAAQTFTVKAGAGGAATLFPAYLRTVQN